MYPPTGTLVWMDADASKWKAKEVKNHGPLWIFTGVDNRSGSWGLRSVADRHTCNAMEQGLHIYKKEDHDAPTGYTGRDDTDAGLSLADEAGAAR